MIQSIEAYRVGDIATDSSAVVIFARATVKEPTVRQSVSSRSRFEAQPPTSGPRPIRELVQQVLAQYQLLD
jgi:hypothetical protein